VEELQQVQRRLQLLLAHLAESESGSLTGEVGPPLVQVAVEGEDQLTALLGVQAAD
jgi:DNA-binding protein YbaB